MRILTSINYGKGISEPLLRSLVNCALVSEVVVVSDFPMLKIPGVEWHSTPRWLKSPMYKVTFRGIIRTFTHFLFMIYLSLVKQPDVVIGFHIFPQCVYAFICAKLLRKPVVACIGDWPGIWRKRRKLIPMLKSCSLVTTTGSRTRKYLIQRGIQETKVYARPDPTDTQRYKPADFPKSYDLLFIGRLSPEKNIETILKIVTSLKQLKTELKVGIIGDGPLRDSLRESSINLGIGNCVEFLGYKENPEYYYNVSKILILTSLHEGLPRVMVEAMACRIPCIVPAVGDITDAAIDGYSALVIQEPKDEQGYITAIITLLNDSRLYNKISQHARIIAEENYSLGSATEAWERILRLL